MPQDPRPPPRITRNTLEVILISIGMLGIVGSVTGSYVVMYLLSNGIL